MAVPTRVLIVDDHPLVRRGLAMLIGREPDLEVCGEADGAVAAMQVFHQTRPDFVVVDISLQNGSGLELVKDLVAQRPELRILVCSMHDEGLYAERALRAGACGFVQKQETTDQLLAAIRRVREGRVYLSDAMTERMLARTVGGESAPASLMQTLSDRELEVFEEIGRGITTRQIADKLLLSPKTVETYRENIKAKLNLKNAAELLQRAMTWVLDREGAGRASCGPDAATAAAVGNWPGASGTHVPMARRSDAG